MKPATLLLVAVLLAAITNSFAESSTEALSKLEAAVAKENESSQSPDADNHENRRRALNGRSLMMRIASYVNRNDVSDQKLEQSLSELSSLFTSDEVHKAAAALGAIVKKEAESAKNAELAEVNGALKQARDAVANAHKPEELDEPLKNLARFFDRPRSSNLPKEVQEALGQTRPASVFLQHWQNYLAANSSGNATQAREALQSISGIDSPGLVPRSKILLELQKYPDRRENKADPITTAQIDEIVRKAKTLDDVQGVIEQLRELRNRGGDGQRSYDNSEPLAATLNTLVRIEQNYRELQGGFPPRVEGIPVQYPSDASSASVIPLKAQLLLLVLQRHLGLPADKGAKPGETVQAFLDRIHTEARTRGDSKLLSRVGRVESQLAGDRSERERSADEDAWQEFHAAENQEGAGQFIPAVVSYERVLKIGSDAVPAKVVGEKLAALQTAHPQEYEAGVKQFLNVREDR